MQNTLPIHVQLENLIRNKIANGEYAIGSCLPSERRLAETYGINRLTVRAALKNLRQEGLIVAHQGRGNFVNSARMRLSFSSIRGFGTQLKSQGVVHTSKVLIAQKVPANHKLSRCFQLPMGTPLYHLTRIRIGNSHAIVIDDTYFPFSLIPDVEKIDFSVESLYHNFEKNQIILAEARQTLMVTILTDEDAQLLELPPNSPVFCINHQVSDVSGRLVEYTLSYVNPERANITSYLKNQL
mgnify:CR=1 FL=1